MTPALAPAEGAAFGAHAQDGGVAFAVFSDHASALELCLFDDTGTHERRRLPMHGPAEGVWHGFLPGAAPGLVYGYRAHGPYAPAHGHRFNPHKLLLDPCAQEIVGRFAWRPEHHGYTLGEGDASFDTRDNAAGALKARVPARAPAPAVPRPRLAETDLVLCELHVKGFGARHPDIPPALRGTYAGLAHPAAIAHFQRLGITTLSLLPVHYPLDEPMLDGSGRVNYWGYNTLGFFCPDPRWSCTPGDPAAVNAEFRAMVDTLHAHGLEVVLDVVFNHTAEGSERGATISFRGLDHASWYRLDAQGRCLNWSACGNTLNVAHPRVTQFVLDALRHWVQAMGVDGFRFDLAPVLGRTRAGGFDAEAAFFTALAQDPVLSRVRLIAEPWDAGPHGYQLGRFPARWMDWNDRFRDAARRFWLARGGDAFELAERFSASGDLFGPRRPAASVNFIAVHDGFTLADLTAHEAKRNHANGEDNRDGRDDEVCAAVDPAARPRVRRALLATLLLAQGTPMLLAGDEFGNGQQGNNNAWNQDNELGWLDWPNADDELTRFVAALTALRRREPALRDAHRRRTAIERLDATPGEPAFLLRLEDAGLVVAFNPRAEPVAAPGLGACRVLLDSSGGWAEGHALAAGAALPAHALVVLRPIATATLDPPDATSTPDA